uniref:Uncharacterized protein n=1 Tax=Melopsittacus undulatus TaxID=13146 RepID=A0A8V5GR18_MELUD
MSRPMSRPPVPPGSPRRLGALSTAQLRSLLQDEPRLQRAARLSRKAQVEQFLAQDLPLDSFLESFCQSRTRSHICRTQLEKLQELLQKDWGGRDPAGPTVPKAFNLSYGFVHHLPALGHQPESPCCSIPSPGSPLHLVGPIPLLSPQPSCRQQEQKQELPHR